MSARALRAVTALGWLVAVTVGGLLFGAGPSPTARGTGATLALVGVTTAVGWSVRWFARPPAPELTRLDGVPATRLARRAGPFRAGIAVLAELTVAAVVAAVAAGTGGDTGLALALALLAVALARPVVLALTGRVVAGGVWLTPDGLVSQHRGVELTAAWSAVALAVGDDARGYVALRPRPGVPLVPVRRAGSLRAANALATDDLALVPAAGLAVDPSVLARWVELLTHDPVRRAELGDASGLRTLAEIAAATPR